jgi:hypothetical protein
MRCECEYSKGTRYEQCDKEAANINSWGHLFCDEHASPTDIPLDTKRYKKELDLRVKVRKEQLGKSVSF